MCNEAGNAPKNAVSEMIEQCFPSRKFEARGSIPCAIKPGPIEETKSILEFVPLQVKAGITLLGRISTEHKRSLFQPTGSLCADKAVSREYRVSDSK